MLMSSMFGCYSGCDFRFPCEVRAGPAHCYDDPPMYAKYAELGWLGTLGGKLSLGGCSATGNNCLGNRAWKLKHSSTIETVLCFCWLTWFSLKYNFMLNTCIKCHFQNITEDETTTNREVSGSLTPLKISLSCGIKEMHYAIYFVWFIHVITHYNWVSSLHL